MQEFTDRLKNLVKTPDDYGRPVHGDAGPFTRPITQAEWEFINNDRLVCKFDFPYFAKLHCSSKIVTEAADPRNNTVDRIKEFLKPQQMLLAKIAKLEEEIADKLKHGEPVDGIRLILNKARQLGATIFSRFASMHRMIFWVDTGATTASIGLEEIQSIYDKDKVIFDNLPWWLKPEVLYDTKHEQIKFAAPNNSNINYFQANQKGGMGTGFTISIVHLTEVGLWETKAGKESVDKIRFDLIPAIPQAANVLVLFESTPNGRGNYWHNLVMNSWSGKTDFNVYYCPFYSEPRKYRKTPPEGWEPNDVTKGMIQRVVDTSPVYMMGETVRLKSEQAYWWEFNYEVSRTEGTLSSFLSNYSATLEESFQHSGDKAFGIEQMQWVRSNNRPGIPYEITGRRAA